MLDEVWAFLGATPGLRTDGHNVMLYRPGASGGDVAVEVGVQVTASFEPVGRVVPSVLPTTEAGNDRAHRTDRGDRRDPRRSS